MDIPKHLEENVLLKVLRKQLTMLLGEMDSTTEEAWPSTRTQAGVGAKETSSTSAVEVAKMRFLATRAGKAA